MERSGIWRFCGCARLALERRDCNNSYRNTYSRTVREGCTILSFSQSDSTEIPSERTGEADTEAKTKILRHT
jgi:hypothetical protein